MKYCTSLVTACVLALLFTACSKHPTDITKQKATNLGTMEVSDGKPQSYVLPSGETCVITPTILSNNIVRLVTRIDYTNSFGTTQTETFILKVPSGDTVFFDDPNTNKIRLRPHISK